MTYSTRRFVIFCVLPLLAASAVVQDRIERTPERQLEVASNRWEDIPTDQVAIERASTLMLGGFKALAVDYLWMRLADLTQEHQWIEAAQVEELLTKLQPRNEEVWSFLTWDLAYNIPANLEDVGDKWKYVTKGIQLGEEGARRNPMSPAIVFNLAFVIQHRLKQDTILAERYHRERGKSPFAEARGWYEACRRILAEWSRREGPEAAYYTPGGVLISDQILTGLIREVSLLNATWQLIRSNDAAAAREGIERSLVEVRQQLAHEDSTVYRRWKAMCEDFLVAVAEDEAAQSLQRSGRLADARARLVEVWKAYRKVILNPGDPNEPYQRRMDMIHDTFILNYWLRIGTALGADRYEPNDLGPFWTKVDFTQQQPYRANLAPLRDDVDRYWFVPPAAGKVRFEVRYPPGQLALVLTLGEYGAGDLVKGYPLKELKPEQFEEDAAAGRITLVTPPVRAGVEYLFQVTAAPPPAPWSTEPYQFTIESLPK